MIAWRLVAFHSNSNRCNTTAATNTPKQPVTAQCIKVPLQNVINAILAVPPCSNSLVDPFPSRPQQRLNFSTIMDRNIYFDEAG